MRKHSTNRSATAGAWGLLCAFAIGASAVALAAEPTPQRLGPEQVAQLRAFLETGMTQLGIPGVAFALVDDGKVVAAEGLGVTDLRNPSPVTDRTLFMIGSNTKSMTTLLQAKLVDEGKVAWTTPVSKIYPEFRLGDSATTAKVEFRHLACMCTGIPSGDLEWILGMDRKTDPAATFRMLASTQPTAEFGEVAQYNNAIVAAAGFIAGHLVHPELPLVQAYSRAMQEKVFGPLGMMSTTFDLERVLARHHAMPHGLDREGRPAPGLYIGDYPAMSPAGSAWSDARDMAKYVSNELSLGRSRDGRALFSKTNLLFRRQNGLPFMDGSRYALGLITKDHGGIEVVGHRGGTPGFISMFSVIPQARIGAVLLTNSEQGGPLIEGFERRLIEVVYGAEPKAAAEVAAAAARATATIAEQAAGSHVPPTESAAAKLAARYTGPGMLKIDVRKAGRDVYFGFGMFECRVAQVDGSDGSVGFSCADPGSFTGATFVVGTRDGHPTLAARQRGTEYVFFGK